MNCFLPSPWCGPRPPANSAEMNFAASQAAVALFGLMLCCEQSQGYRERVNNILNETSDRRGDGMGCREEGYFKHWFI